MTATGIVSTNLAHLGSVLMLYIRGTVNIIINPAAIKLLTLTEYSLFLYKKTILEPMPKKTNAISPNLNASTKVEKIQATKNIYKIGSDIFNTCFLIRIRYTNSAIIIANKIFVK